MAATVPARNQTATTSPGALALEIVAVFLLVAGGLLTNWLWPEKIDYDQVTPVAAAPALAVLGLFVVAAATCWSGAAIVRAIGRRS